MDETKTVKPLSFHQNYQIVTSPEKSEKTALNPKSLLNKQALLDNYCLLAW